MSDKILSNDKATGSLQKTEGPASGEIGLPDNEAFKIEHARRAAASARLAKSGILPNADLDWQQTRMSAQQKGQQPGTQTDGHNYIKGTSFSLPHERELLNGIATGVYNSLVDPVIQLARSPNATNASIGRLYETAKDLGQYISGKISDGDYKGLKDDVSNVVKELKTELDAFPKKPPFEQGKALGEAASFLLPLPPIGKLAKLERLEEESTDAGRLLDAVEKAHQPVEQIQTLTDRHWEMPRSTENLTSESFRAELKEAIAQLSPEERAFLTRKDIPILGVRRLQDIMDGHDKSIGLYNHAKKPQIFIPEELNHGTAGWKRNTDLAYALRHEVGHAVDLNQVEPLSDNPDFARHVEKDMQLLSTEQREYLANVFKNENIARKEVFAAAYARVKGAPSNTEFQQIVQELFPNSFKYVEGKIDDAIKR